MPWPIASLASSGIRPLSSVLARSCLRCASRVRRKIRPNSAQLLEALMSTTRTASIRGLGASVPERRGASAALNAAPELFLRGQKQVLVEGIGRARALLGMTQPELAHAAGLG